MSTRNRATSPSMNWPQSETEAYLALLRQVRRTLLEDNGGIKGALTRTYSTDAGLGTTRSEEAVTWLSSQQDRLNAEMSVYLDGLEQAAFERFEEAS